MSLEDGFEKLDNSSPNAVEVCPST